MKTSTCMVACLFMIFATEQPAECSASQTKMPGVLFSRFTDDNWQIWAKQLSIGEEYQVTFSPVDKRSPQCNASGLNFVYRTANSELYLLDLLQGSEKEILSQFGFIMDQRWSPDGKKMAFSRLRSDLLDDSDVWVADINGENITCLTNETGIQFNPIWSPDSQKIAYASDELDDSNGFAIWLMDTDGRNKQRLTNGKKYDVEPAFSPDRKTIVFSSDQTGDFEIWSVDVVGGNEIRLTHSPGIDTTPIYSQDGKKIIFTSFRDDVMQLWIMDQDGKHQSPLTSSVMPAKEPCWCELDSAVWQRIKKRSDIKESAL